MSETPPLLETRSLVKTYGARDVVRGISLRINEGEVVGLLGPNGAGKTTTFRMVVGMIHPDRGEVWHQGENITRMPMYLRARRGIGYLTQDPSVFSRLTVEENILAILEYLPLDRRQRRLRLEEHLEDLGLTRLRKSKASTLSGGERRRLEVTRALVTSPRLLFLDEPFVGIDPIAVADIKHIVHDLKDRGISVFITDHAVEKVLPMTDRSYVIQDGSVLMTGSPVEVISAPEVREAYLGDDFRLPELEEQERARAIDLGERRRPRRRGELPRWMRDKLEEKTRFSERHTAGSDATLPDGEG